MEMSLFASLRNNQLSHSHVKALSLCARAMLLFRLRRKSIDRIRIVRLQISGIPWKRNMDPQRFSEMYTTEQEVPSGPSGGARKRRIPDNCNPNDGIYEELEKLRNLVEEVESERPGCSTFSRGTIDSSLMSTVFGIVLVMIISISVYAFTNLFKALIKRFYSTPED